MAISIQLYVNNSEDYALNKSLSGQQNFTNCIIKENCSVIDPTIVITTNIDLTQYNYMYIPDFHRYYFIKQISIFPNGMYHILAHVDVLYTYRHSILGCNAIVSRNESKYNRYLDDPEFKILNSSDVVTKQFSAGSFTKSLDYILVTAGG